MEQAPVREKRCDPADRQRTDTLLLKSSKQKTGRRPKVGVVMIKCPQTGREIPTGIKADRERFRCSAVFFARTYCSICQANHEWFAKEAWVYESSEIAETMC
jgi:hypothetical protein